MKSNIQSAANCLTVDTIWFDLLYITKREHKIDPCNTPKKSKQNKVCKKTKPDCLWYTNIHQLCVVGSCMMI